MSEFPLLTDPLCMSPYGVRGRNVGITAIKTAEVLVFEEGWDANTNSEHKWSAADYEAFAQTVRFLRDEHHGYGDLYLTSSGGTKPWDENAYHYSDHLTRLHLTLPFTEGEQHTLVDEIYRLMPWSWQKLDNHTVDRIRKRESFDLFEAGRHRSVAGGTLINAFWAWRHNALEFEGSGSKEIAVDALRSMGGILLADVPDHLLNSDKLDEIAETRRKHAVTNMPVSLI